MAAIVDSKIAAQQVTHPDQILLIDGQIEPQITMNGRDSFGRCAQAQDHLGRIAGHQAQQQEDEHRHAEQDRYR